MANVSMGVVGFDEILAKLQSLGSKANDSVRLSLQSGAAIVQEAMISNVPVSHVEHVHIKEDIETSKVKGSGLNRYITIGPGRRTNWRAKFLEFGTSKMTAEPFMMRSLTENRAKVMENVRNKLREGLGL